jgi:D-aminoacyl-tRNA deacylase
MRVVLQRVLEAKLSIQSTIHSSIKKGLVILIGIDTEDTKEDMDWLIPKILQLRIFSDQEGLMNLSVQDIQGEILVVSQFTLFASTKKGNRPGFTKAAVPTVAKNLYEDFLSKLKEKYKGTIQVGIFGADMEVMLINDGPVTIIIDTKNKE